MFKNKVYVISPIALVALSACRGTFDPAGNPVTGNIVKGPLNNALVFLDLDGDNVLDANEQSIRTDANGKFTINTNATNYKIVALTDDSTVDTSSGAVLAGVTLSAPKGASVVTPTTTLMEEGGLTAAEVAEVLGLPDGVDPLTFNPFEAGVDATKALEVEKLSQQIMTAVSSFASAAEGAGASEKGAFEAALKSVVDVIKVKAEKIKDPNAAAADKKIDFTKAADLDLIKAKVADEAEKVVKAEGTTGFDKVAMANLVNDTTTSIKNVNDQIKAVKDLNSDATKNVFSTLQVLSEQVKTAAIAEKANKGSGSIEFKDAAKVKTATANKAPTDIKLSATSIMEGSKDLVIGSLSTTDVEQTSGFKYEIAKIKGTDHSLFSINSKGELVLSGTPDHSKQSSYKLFVTTTDAGGKKFSKEISIDVLKDPSLQVKAGELATINYKAIDKGGSFIKDATLTFKNEIGEVIQLTDKDNDGIASARIDTTTSNGTYVLHKIELNDANTLSNKVVYEQGAKTTTIKGVETTEKHSVDFSKFALIVTGGKDAQTDFTAPELTSVTMGATTAKVGERTKLDYKVKETGSFVKEAEFVFKNNLGQSIKFIDTDNDGTAYSSIPMTSGKGDFVLHQVKLTDHNGISNIAEYDTSGNLKTTTKGVVSTGKHTMVFSNTKFSVSDGIVASDGTAQDDFTPPELSAIAFSSLFRTGVDKEVTQKDDIELGYRASETARDTFVNAEFIFKNTAGNSISMSDPLGLGTARAIISDTVTKGTYTLDQIILKDSNISPNIIKYEANGDVTKTIKGVTSSAAKHTFNFTPEKFTVLENSRSETVKPTLKAITTPVDSEGDTKDAYFGIGETSKYSIEYTTDATDVASVTIKYTSADGGEIVFEDHDLAESSGKYTAEALLNDPKIFKGKYGFKEATIVDFNGNSNTYTDSDFGRVMTFEVKTGKEVLIAKDVEFGSLTPEASAAKFDEVFDIAYTIKGDDGRMLPKLNEVELDFKHVSLNSKITFIDTDADGVASSIITGSGIPDGEYKFEGSTIKDSHGNESTATSRDFDTKFTLKGGKIVTDTAAPTLKSAVLDKTDINVGTIASIKYVGDGTGSEITDVSFTFAGRTVPDKKITFTDRDGDGVATAFISDVVYPSDMFRLTNASIIDGGGNTTNYTDKARELDLNLQFTVNVPRATDQTDFEAPELDLTEFLEFNEIV